MAIETTEDRTTIPTLDETKLIALNETRMLKVGTSVVGVLGAIGAGVLTFIGLANSDIKAQDPGLVLAGAAFIFAVSILAWAIVAAADIGARGQATAANLALRAKAFSQNVTPSEARGLKSCGMVLTLLAIV